MTVPDPGFPVTIRGDDGGWVRVEPGSFEGAPGSVWIRTSILGVSLDAEQCEAFAQAWIAACHEADRRAGVEPSDPGPAPNTPASWPYCESQQPSADPLSGFLCTAAPGHEPLDHAAWTPDGAALYARWPALPLPPRAVTEARCLEPHPERDHVCTAPAGHAPLDHAAHDGQGQVCARWPVSDG